MKAEALAALVKMTARELEQMDLPMALLGVAQLDEAGDMLISQNMEIGVLRSMVARLESIVAGNEVALRKQDADDWKEMTELMDL